MNLIDCQKLLSLFDSAIYDPVVKSNNFGRRIYEDNGWLEPNAC